MSSAFSSKQLKAEALRLGFSACGIAEAAPVDAATADRYRQWIARGGHAGMHYLANNIDKRLDPTLLLPGARTIIVVAMSYAPAQRLPQGEYQIADYALGQDYHDVLKLRLRRLWSPHASPTPAPPQTADCRSDAAGEALICVDTVPILERYWAQRAGIGFIGRNHQLILPGAGSMVFLGEIVTTAVADEYDTPADIDAARCGTCHRCLDACPTGALHAAIDSQLCLSYQTIENRGALSPLAAGKLGQTIYGCDRCQAVCPWNRSARPTEIAELQPSEALLGMTADKWHTLTVEEYRRLFRRSAVKRAKYEGLMRNIEAVRQHN